MASRAGGLASGLIERVKPAATSYLDDIETERGTASGSSKSVVAEIDDSEAGSYSTQQEGNQSETAGNSSGSSQQVEVPETNARS